MYNILNIKNNHIAKRPKYFEKDNLQNTNPFLNFKFDNR